MSRYLKRGKGINDFEMYDKLLKKRGIKKVLQYRSPEGKYVPREYYLSMETHEHIWIQGDSFENLAERFYGDPRHWWVIASFNKLPTEQHVSYGKKIIIPVYLVDALAVVS